MTMSTSADPFEEFLEQANAEQLRNYLKDLVVMYPEIRDFLLMRKLKPESGSTSVDSYRKLVREGIGPIDPKRIIFLQEATRRLAPVHALLDEGDIMLEDRPEEATKIARAVIEEMYLAMPYIDDSYGSVGDLIRMSTELLQYASGLLLEDEDAAELFEWLKSARNREPFIGWDSQARFTEILPMVAYTAAQKKETEQILTDDLKKYKAKIKSGDIPHQAAPLITTLLLLYELNQDEDSIVRIFQEYDMVPEVHTYQIEMAFDGELFDACKALTLNAIETFEDDPAVDTSRWYAMLSVLAEIMDNIEEMITYSVKLFWLSPSLSTYEDLKYLIPGDQWDSYFEKEIYPNIPGKGISGYLYLSILQQEGKTEDIFTYLQQYPDYELILLFEQDLRAEDPERLFDLFRGSIMDLMKYKTGRKYYKMICGRLEHLYVSGFRKETASLIGELEKTYANRPSLLEELQHLRRKVKSVP